MNPDHRPDRTVSVPWSADTPVRDRRFGEFLCGLWTSACDALAVPADEAERTTAELRDTLPAWAGERIGDRPRQPSFVAADGFPAEMSLNWSGGEPELRMLLDCLSDVDGAGSAVTAPSQRFHQLTEIFATAPLWYSLAWRPPAPMAYKAYFGLYAWPAERRFAALDRAMERLGMARAWDDARRRVDRDGRGDRREVEFLGLDLTGTAQARAKIYYRNHGADVHELNRMASVAADHDPDRALTAYRTLVGERADAGTEALTCLAFRSGLDRAAESTTYLRMPSLVSGDLAAVERAADVLVRQGVDPRPLRAVAAALAPTALAESRGLLELVSYRAAGRPGDLTTYFRFPVYAQPAPLPGAPVDLVDRSPIVSQSDVQRVADHNATRQEEYEASRLIRLLADEATPDTTKKAVLTYLQPWSNAFQRMISARVTYESDLALRTIALEHQKEEIGHDEILARTRAEDQRVVWDPVIEAGASWFVDQFATLPGVQRAILAHLALEAGSLALSKAGVVAFPNDPYFSLHDEADVEHLEMGYQILRERTDWTVDEIVTVLDRAWQVITVVSDRIAECAIRDTAT
ncbi:hypothetical protein O7626_09100 [Micromonospora sp. WMMD1102]|uniref:hypothetical protein n=1 Tax=Micromonospora sp. WMMD1102 TaxID=3016105 RepID=UPI0024154447|nr:hypothetical protein [Micromonospora sp. WMMD1102]MDG4786080.1 hypothetical protein [Micromonospora sp. WMMD1102]